MWPNGDDQQLADPLQIFQLAGVQEFLPSQPVMGALFGVVCGIVPAGCAAALDEVAGYDAADVLPGRLPLFLAYSPAGASGASLALFTETHHE